nr:hypothetical protein [Arthrobacter crystallopoietes]
MDRLVKETEVEADARVVRDQDSAFLEQVLYIDFPLGDDPGRGIGEVTSILLHVRVQTEDDLGIVFCRKRPQAFVVEQAAPGLEVFRFRKQLREE